MMKGSYLLLVELKNDKKIDVGKLRNIEFKNGFYVYVGSAFNGLDQRIKRHLSYKKKIYWHIDYLLKHANITDIYYLESRVHQECSIAKKLGEKLSLICGFGCSDCKCKSHLFYGSKKDITSIIFKLGMKKYVF